MAFLIFVAFNLKCLSNKSSFWSAFFMSFYINILSSDSFQASPGRPTSRDRPCGWQIVRRRRNRVPWLEYGLRRRERRSSFRREWASSWHILLSLSKVTYSKLDKMTYSNKNRPEGRFSFAFWLTFYLIAKYFTYNHTKRHKSSEMATF